MSKFLEITTATHIGGRGYQEDRIVVVEKDEFVVVAVFDGHAGQWTAQAAADLLPKIVDKSVEDIFKELISATYLTEGGSTATIAKITPDSITYGVMGDSPIVIYHADANEVEIGPNHNVRTNLKERQDAIMRGGWYHQSGYIMSSRHMVNYGLQMSRALGDADMGTALLREAEVFSTSFGPGDVAILATDGVLYEGEDLTKLLDLESADQVVEDALNRRTHDNVSAVYVKRSA